MFTDTHVHFESDADTTDMPRSAIAAGVMRMLAVGGSEALNQFAITAAQNFSGNVRLALGLDRSQTATAAMLRPLLEKQIAEKNPCALGEIGLDFHYHPETRDAQCVLFDDMLRLAGTLNLPAIIHTREADDDTLRVLGEAGSPAQAAAGRLGVVHCFTGGEAFARALLDRGLFLSFSGILTFRNADALREVARFVPDDRLLIETDSPFLAPVPQRGSRNQPAFIVHVAERLASLRGTSTAKIAELTTRNAEKLFGPWSLPAA
jgi:TatD DNase family protein